MNILDENVIDNQRHQLLSWRIPVRQIGYEIGVKGMKDHEIIPFLHKLNKPTFLLVMMTFTIDVFVMRDTLWFFSMLGKKR